MFRLDDAGLGELLVGDKAVRVVEVVLVVVVVVDFADNDEVPLSFGLAAAGAALAVVVLAGALKSCVNSQSKLKLNRNLP